MNRKDFGELVAALRQDLGWTQFQLAEYSGLDGAVISQIERGVKRFFEPELLFCLANAFQLTTLERREFIFASSGLDEKQMVRQPSEAMATDVFDAKKVLEKLVSLTGQIRLPAYISDVFGDVVAANYMMLALYNVSASLLEQVARLPGGFNTTRLNFGHDSVSRTQVIDNWEGYALNAMRSFRESTLRYRAWPYFKYLMKIFRNPAEFPFFDRYWKLVSSTEQDKDVALDIFQYQHRKLGPIKYTSTSTNAFTSFGNLYLVQNLPLDQQTEQAFLQLQKEAGLGVVRLASWPEKNFP
jgi:transcriptional regulator with XRE-family HTH domain